MVRRHMWRLFHDRHQDCEDLFSMWNSEDGVLRLLLFSCSSSFLSSLFMSRRYSASLHPCNEWLNTPLGVGGGGGGIERRKKTWRFCILVENNAQIKWHKFRKWIRQVRSWNMAIFLELNFEIVLPAFAVYFWLYACRITRCVIYIILKLICFFEFYFWKIYLSVLFVREHEDLFCKWCTYLLGDQIQYLHLIHLWITDLIILQFYVHRKDSS